MHASTTGYSVSDKPIEAAVPHNVLADTAQHDPLATPVVGKVKPYTMHLAQFFRHLCREGITIRQIQYCQAGPGEAALNLSLHGLNPHTPHALCAPFMTLDPHVD